MEAVLMPHQDYIAVAIRVDGQGRTAKGSQYQTDALAWAERL